MTQGFFLAGDALRRSDGAALDPVTLRWHPGAAPPDGASPLTAVEAARWVLGPGGGRRLPAAIIGPRDPTPGSLAAAEAVAREPGS